MDTVFQVGLIGCGAIAQKKHLPLCMADAHLHVRMVCDSDFERACACAAEYGAQAVRAPEEIFAAPALDVVIIATPNCTHAPYAIAALQAGKHVLCEKPMALSSADAGAMLAASESSGKLLHISYQNRYTDQALHAERLCREGALGQVYCAKAYAIRRRALPTWGAAMRRAVQGGGVLADIGSHAIDLALWLSGSFTPAYAVATTYDHFARRGSEANFWGNWDGSKNDVEDGAFGFVVMHGGMTLTIDASYALNIAEEYEASADLFGTEGGIRLREQEGLTLIHELGGRMCATRTDLQASRRTLTPQALAQTPSAREHAAFVQMLLDGRKSDPAAVQAAAVAKIIEGLYRSAQTHQPVYFDTAAPAP